MSHDITTVPAPLSDVEHTKRGSHHLRGGLVESVVSDAPCFGEEDSTILKAHGVYQQDDRDRRVKRATPSEKAWQMMVRLTIPGGVLTADQYLALDALADRLGNGSLRLTTRQSIQFHGVAKRDLKPLLAEIHRLLLSTLAACGDVARNVMATAAPLASEAHVRVQRVAREIAAELRPRTGAYYEVWLDGERAADSREAEEPLYGEAYLPRKFKVGVAVDTDNDIDILAYDCGLVGITEDGHLTGFTLVVGGGLGMTHNKPRTFARLATPIAFVAPEHAATAARLVCEVYRDHGNRSDRKAARIKYLVESWGAERFLEELRRRASIPLEAPRPIRSAPSDDHLGARPQGDGRWYYGLHVQSGRISDTADVRIRSAIRAVVAALRPGVRLTAGQNIIFSDLRGEDIARLEAILVEHGLPLAPTTRNVVRHSLACPALPTCGLALAESERVLPTLLEELQQTFERLGIADTPLTVRMTGCPNGCARPYTADIGFVGRRPGVYHIFVGGGLSGNELCDLFAADVRYEHLVAAVTPLLQRYASERTEGESVGAFYRRIAGREEPRRLLTGHETPTAASLGLAGVA